MPMTFSQMKASVITNHGGRDDLDALVMTALQFAQDRIVTDFEYNEIMADPLTDTLPYTADVSADSMYALPSNTNKLHALTLIDGTSQTPMEGYTITRWEKEIGSQILKGTGKPSVYVQYGKTIIFNKPVDQEYGIRVIYSAWPIIDLNETLDAPENDTDVSILDHKDMLIVVSATSYVFMALGNMEKANYWFTVYKDLKGGANEHGMLNPSATVKPGAASSVPYSYDTPRFRGM